MCNVCCYLKQTSINYLKIFNYYFIQIDDQEPMPGYLSLHQDSNGLSIKWTPNQLINGRVNQPSSDGNNDGFFNHSMDKTYDIVFLLSHFVVYQILLVNSESFFSA